MGQEQERDAKFARADQIRREAEARQKQQDRDDKREKRFNRRIAIMTVVLAVLSVAIAVIATPQQTLSEKIEWSQKALGSLQDMMAERRKAMR